MAAAAHTVLRRLAPAQSTAVDGAYKSALSESCRRTAKDERREAWADSGRKAAGIAYCRRVRAEGRYQAERWARLLSIDAATLHAADLSSLGRGELVIRLDDSYKSKGPPRLDSAQFKADFDEVKLLGARHSSARTADQTAAAVFWTVQTGVPWFAAARAAAAERKAAVLDNLHLFALLSVAVANSQIACFKDKYDRLHWRPITAIRAAAVLKTAALLGDAGWEPLLGTPPHPEYPSAHACFSGAAEAVLRGELTTTV